MRFWVGFGLLVCWCVSFVLCRVSRIGVGMDTGLGCYLASKGVMCFAWI